MDVVTDDKMGERVKVFVNKLNEKLDTPQDLAYRHLIKADALRMRNFFWEAIDEYLLVIKNDSVCFDAYKGLGHAYKQVGFTESAVSAFKSAQKIYPFDKTLYYEIGCCLCMDKKYSKAIKAYKKALKFAPEYEDAKLNLALAYELNNQHREAFEIYKDIISQNPKNTSAYNALGSLYIKLEMHCKAIKVFKDLIKTDNTYTRAYLGLAIALDKINCFKDALKYYKKYTMLKPNCGNMPFIIDRITEIKNTMPQREKTHLKLVS
jgi:tetratricopeptide (TPR) repeat protein